MGASIGKTPYKPMETYLQMVCPAAKNKSMAHNRGLEKPSQLFKMEIILRIV